jgi:CheY-like chemotaxis protein
MWIESQVGQGTTFYFQLPIEPIDLVDPGVSRWINPSQTYATIEKPIKPPSLPLADGRTSILVIEKGTVLQRLLKRYLAHTEIRVAPDLETARRELEHVPARLVLMNDPGLQSPDVLSAGAPEILTEAAPFPEHLPIISCSIAEPLLYAPNPDVIEILVKPITRDILLSAVEKSNHPVENILVVEDEPDAQKLFLRMLFSADRGYKVRRASNGIQALRLLKEQNIDLVLLDLFMPEMDGFELLQRKARDPKLRDIPVILISARDPHGQPIVSSHLTVTRRSGLTVQQLLDSIQAISTILAPGIS